MQKEVAVYKGDNLVGIGTVSEMAELLGVKEDTIMWYTSPAATRRGKRVTVAVLLEQEEQE